MIAKTRDIRVSFRMTFADIDRADGGRQWRQHFFFPLPRRVADAVGRCFFPPSPASVEASARPRREKMGRARAASPISLSLRY